MSYNFLGGLQIGGGINDKNALTWIGFGASKVCKNLELILPVMNLFTR